MTNPYKKGEIYDKGNYNKSVSDFTVYLRWGVSSISYHKSFTVPFQSIITYRLCWNLWGKAWCKCSMFFQICLRLLNVWFTYHRSSYLSCASWLSVHFQQAVFKGESKEFTYSIGQKLGKTCNKRVILFYLILKGTPLKIPGWVLSFLDVIHCVKVLGIDTGKFRSSMWSAV